MVYLQAQELQQVTCHEVHKRSQWQPVTRKRQVCPRPTEYEHTHYGPRLRAEVLSLYARGLTEVELLEHLQSLGVEVSTYQVHSLLHLHNDRLIQLCTSILSHGLVTAPWIGVDDTGGLHQHQNYYGLVVQGEFFAFFKTSKTKSRAKLLQVLLQGEELYVINNPMIYHLSLHNRFDGILWDLEPLKGRR